MLRALAAVTLFAVILPGCGDGLVPLIVGADSTEAPSAVCPGPDRFEPNRQRAQAALLELDARDQIVIGAGIGGGERDFYRLVAPRADPVRFIVRFVETAPGEPLLALEISDEGERVLAETSGGPLLELLAPVQVAGASIFLLIRADAGACTPYELALDAAYCPDAEDDDAPASAASLEPQAWSEARVITGDDDVWRPAGLVAGCTVEVEPSVTLSLAALAEDGRVVRDVESTVEGGVSRAAIDLDGARLARVRTASPRCVSYRIRCD
ncbi:MAG: hypothetical protein IT384_06355 [Deltaproteobacteria bacterium]|nr:hypothetical protein [Deltaproteobacteria bacterium]